MKQLVLGGLTHRAITPLWRPFLRGTSAIFMLHRFDDRERNQGVHAHNPNQLRSYLEFLRRERHSIVALSTLLDSLEAGESPASRVVFTVDDGYDDFLHVAMPIFAEFDVPVTLFVTTGFIDRTCWFWWDQVDYILRETTHRFARAELGMKLRTYRWTTADERVQVTATLVDQLKTVPDAEVSTVIAALAEQLEVTLPRQAPAWCAPMTWSEIRSCVSRGAEIGPHTLSHPILSRTGGARAAAEIRGSWERLREEIPDPLAVFCYPNGDPGSFTAREIELVKDLGLRAAMSTFQEHVTVPIWDAPSDPAAPNRFALPRFTYPPSHAHLVQIVSGLERAKGTLRRLLPR